MLCSLKNLTDVALMAVFTCDETDLNKIEFIIDPSHKHFYDDSIMIPDDATWIMVEENLFVDCDETCERECIPLHNWQVEGF